MKSIFCIVFITLVFARLSHGQVALLIKKDGNRTEVQITSHNNANLITKTGIIKIRGIDSLYFTEKLAKDEHLYGVLSKWRVKVVYGYVSAFSKPLEDTKPLVKETTVSPVFKISEEVRIYQLEENLEKFRAQSAKGFGVQIAGAIVIATSAVLQSIYNKNYNDDLAAWQKNPTPNQPQGKEVNAGFPITGGLLMVIGFGVNVDALRHLRKKR